MAEEPGNYRFHNMSEPGSLLGLIKEIIRNLIQDF